MEQPKKDPQKELEIALSELEERVDRLRSLYEQYFMGYEKIEPGVQRKDVDRRFLILRKTQIRNTAQRYRFNVVTQKFNTYVMYWTRICRQIEEGTFKRHVQRAARRFGGPGRRPEEVSIDVDLADFDSEDLDMDMDDVLAEANAAAEAYVSSRGGGNPDTVPPSAKPVSSAGGLRGRIPPVAERESTTSFAMTGSRETFDALPEDDDATPQPMRAPSSTQQPAHVHRAAAPIGGGKPRIVLRKRGDGDAAPPPSTRQIDPFAGPHPAAHNHLDIKTPSSPMRVPPPSQARPPMGSSSGVERVDRVGAGPPSSSVIRPSPGAGAAAARGIPSPRGPMPSAPESARRIPLPAPSVREGLPPPPEGSRPRIGPVGAPHARPQIAPRTPGSPQMPVKLPQSSPQTPAAAGPPPPSAKPLPPSVRTPVRPAGAGSVGQIPPAAPVGPASRPVGPASRPSIPSMPDSDQPRPSRRAPPPLPSQLSKKK